MEASFLTDDREYSLTMETKLPLALASGFNKSANYMGFSPIWSLKGMVFYWAKARYLLTITIHQLKLEAIDGSIFSH
jgi:hypothetical protein